MVENDFEGRIITLILLGHKRTTMEGWISIHRFSRIRGEHLLGDAGFEVGKSAGYFHGLLVQRGMVPYMMRKTS